MRKPNVGKPRSASAMFTLSRRLPKLSLPASAPPSPSARAHPRVGKPGAADGGASGPLPSMTVPHTITHPVMPPPPHGAPVPHATQHGATTPAASSVSPARSLVSIVAQAPAVLRSEREGACTRCGHDEALHPVRYVCDRYPHADPLQMCGCESETLDNICPTCNHKARAHKPRHRCREQGCHCWGYEQVVALL